MICSHCHRHEPAPDRKLCEMCLATKTRARRRARSPKGLGLAIKGLAREGRTIIKARERRILTPEDCRDIDTIAKVLKK